MRQLLLIGSAALILAVITGQWVAGLPAAARASTAGVRLDDPQPWFPQEPGRVVSLAVGGPAARSGLQKGDQVQAINGIPTWSRHELHRLVDNSRAGESLEYTVLRGSQTRVVPIRLESRLGKIWVDLLCNAFAAVIFFGVGVWVYWKHPKDRRAHTFFWMCLPFALLFSLGDLAYVRQGDFWDPTSLGWEGIITMALFFFLFPPLLHFTLIFPKPRPLLEKYPGILGWVYALPLIAVSIVALIRFTSSQAVNLNLGFSFAQALAELAHGLRSASVALAFGLLAPAAFLVWKWVRSARRKGWRNVLLSRPGLVISTLVFTPLLFGLALVPLSAAFGSRQAFWNWGFIAAAIAIGVELIATLLAQLIIPVAACVSLFRNYRDVGISEKHQLRWPLWGTVTGVAGSFLLFVTLRVLESLGPGRIGAGWLTTLFLLLIPISFAFAIAKYRLMEFPVVETHVADMHFTATCPEVSSPS